MNPLYISPPKRYLINYLKYSLIDLPKGEIRFINYKLLASTKDFGWLIYEAIFFPRPIITRFSNI
jgi:hypothetical protein